jgi:hypothetical protein
MFNNQQVGAKVEIHKFYKNNTRTLETVFDISVLEGHGIGKAKIYQEG